MALSLPRRVAALSRADRFGASASLLCAIHCVGLALLPFLGVVVAESLAVDVALGAVTLGWASYCALRHPKSGRWLWVGIAAAFVLGAILGHEEMYGRFFWIGAGLALMRSHFLRPAVCCPSQCH